MNEGVKSPADPSRAKQFRIQPCDAWYDNMTTNADGTPGIGQEFSQGRRG